MDLIPIDLTNGFPRHRRSLPPARPEAPIVGKHLTVIDIHDVMRSMTRDKSLWVVRDMMTLQEAVDYLVSDPFSPKETMSLMDEVSKYIDKCPDLRALFEIEEDYTIIEIALETYQRWIDEKISSGVRTVDGCFRYVVTRWLGDSSLVVSSEPYTQDQHDARKNYPYSTSIEPHSVSALLRLL